MTICPKCGFQNSPESLFCTNCQQGLYRRTRASTTARTTQSPIKPVINSNIKDSSVESSSHFSSKHKPGEKRYHQESTQEKNGNFTPGSQKTNFEPPQNTPKENTLTRKLFSGLFFITVPAMLYLAYFILGMAEETSEPPDVRASSIFVQAENFYQKKSYLAAQNLYVQFVDEFPEEPLAEIVLRRIEEINNGLLSIEEEEIYKKQRIKILMDKSKSIFEKGSNSIIESNILGLLNEVISLDSTNEHAPEMFSTCIHIYRKEANKAFLRQKYETAKNICNKLLNVLPNDRETLKKLEEINAAIIRLKSKGIAQGKKNTNRPVTAKSDKNTTKEKPQKQKPSATNSASAAGISRSSLIRTPGNDHSANDSQNTVIRKSDSEEIAVTNSSLNSAGNTDLTTLLREKASSNNTPASTVNNFDDSNKKKNNPAEIISSNTPILESFLDAGRRQYLKKVDPDYPRAYLKIKKEGTVIIEVMVGKDGRVVSHRVLQSDGELFTEVCVRALKSYRYKTGTVNKRPVSFKATELFKFKLN